MSWHIKIVFDVLQGCQVDVASGAAGLLLLKRDLVKFGHQVFLDVGGHHFIQIGLVEISLSIGRRLLHSAAGIETDPAGRLLVGPVEEASLLEWFHFW